MGLFETFVDPPKSFTLIPFWFLNDDLSEPELKRQIDDFAAHGVYGFIPHARIGLPDAIGFMSEEWLRVTKVCVAYAAEKGMYVILYDEGMYPSGSCAGQVVAANPRFATRCLERRPKGDIQEAWEIVAEDAHWVYVNRPSGGRIRGIHYGEDDGEAGAPLSADLLNSESNACFFRLVLDGHYAALKEYFGKTVIAVFTDEPSLLGRGSVRGVQPWTWGFAQYLESTLGYDFRPHFGALWDDAAPGAARYRADFTRAVNLRLEQAYYAPYSAWCEQHGIALAGHPAEPGDIGTLKYFHIPGQDIVWRYIEPYRDNAIEGPQSTMAKCSASAQRHYGRTRNMNECFGAYGWNFTYDEMRYITNWLLIRGVNMLCPHAFYYSLRDKRRDERPPDVGPGSAWWPDYKTYADYCRRLCWLLSQGTPVCHFAILGLPTALPWRAARALFEAQRDFNYLDTDTLANACTISSEGVTIRGMSYQAVIIDGPAYATEAALRALEPLAAAGRLFAFGEEACGAAKVCADPAALVGAIDAIVSPSVALQPGNPSLRYAHLRIGEENVYLFANESPEPIRGILTVSAQGEKHWWDPERPEKIEDVPGTPFELQPLCMRVLRVG